MTMSRDESDFLIDQVYFDFTDLYFSSSKVFDNYDELYGTNTARTASANARRHELWQEIQDKMLVKFR